MRSSPRCRTTSGTPPAAPSAEAVRSQRGFVMDDGGEVVGFLTFEPRYDDATEITWMAIRADRRREGLGHILIERVADLSREAGRRLLIVPTVSPSDGPDDIENGYDATRSFYRATGRTASCSRVTSPATGTTTRPSC